MVFLNIFIVRTRHLFANPVTFFHQTICQLSCVIQVFKHSMPYGHFIHILDKCQVYLMVMLMNLKYQLMLQNDFFIPQWHHSKGSISHTTLYNIKPFSSVHY